MPRSLAHGDYSLLLAVESSSRSDSWYRVLTDRQSGALSCDCPPFIFNQQQHAQGERACPHTQVGQRLAAGAENRQHRATLRRIETSRFIVATQEQWPGLRGNWSIEERDALMSNKPYHFVLLCLELGNGGGIATGTVAFSRRHTHTQAHMASRVAGWAGYAIAAEVARFGGLPMAGHVPDHFKVTRREGRRATATSPSDIGLLDILRVADQVDLGDGLRPAERAEKTLRLFLGETLSQQIEHQGFLDVSSVHYSSEQRVYRLRRDPLHQRERRVRIFEYGQYIHDYCLVRGQEVPEADHFLTLALGLLSDEVTTLSVMGRHNIFAPYSEGDGIRETVPAHWQAR